MFSIETTVLLIIDVQGKLAALMDGKKDLFRRLQSLIKAAQILQIPILHTEQAPDKIGRTIPEISNLLSHQRPIEKLSFSCWGNPEFVGAVKKLKRKQILIAGIEAHVCVYQTAVDLKAAGFAVMVAADAVSSRSRRNTELALERMKELGIRLTSTEMIICELIRSAEHKNFREIMGLIK